MPLSARRLFRSSLFVTLTAILAGSFSLSPVCADAPWGEELSSPANEQFVSSLISAAASDPGAAKAMISGWVILAPALYARLKVVDPTLATLGTQSYTIDPVTRKHTEMRAFQPHQIVDLLSSRFLSYLAANFSGGKVRAATQTERAIFYSLISFEIKGLPVSVISKDNMVLLVYNSPKDGLWIEVVSDWRQTPQR